MNIRVWLCATLLSPLSLFSQHDAQRNAVQELAKGDAEGFAGVFLNPRVDAGPEETNMVNLLKLLSEDKVDEAIKLARESLDAGMNPARLLAGSGGFLVKLRAHPKFEELPGVKDVPGVIHGPMVGNVTDKTANIWIRTNGKQSLSISWSAADGTKEATVIPVPETTAENDFTGVVEIAGLKPNTEYTGRILGEDLPLGDFAFSTRPAPGESSRFKVAFGGGAGYVPEWESMWDTIAATEPDALLMLGDNVYIDDPTHLVTQHYCYYRRQSEPHWRSLVSKVPVYSIYDDHDFGDNDCMPGPEIEKPAWKRPVLEVFRQNWVNPGYGGGEENPGCWFEFSIGDVQFFMLDGRYYRDRKSGSMLGPVQKQWLLDGLRKSTSTFKILVSPVPFTEKIKPGSRDPWDGYPEEREEIFSFLESEKMNGVFLVAADRHRTDLRTTDRSNGYPLYEFMSSRLTNRHVHPVVKTPGLVWGYNETCSFGLMEFDTTAKDPQVTFRCIDIDGNEQHSHVLKLSEISH